MALSLLGSANLIRPGLRPNGSSHTASRHRHLGKGRVLAPRVGRVRNGDRSERALHPRKAQAVTRPIPMERGTIELRRSICKCAWRAEGAQNEFGTRPQEAWRLRRTFFGTSQGNMRPRTPSGILFTQVTAVQNDLPARPQRAKDRGGTYQASLEPLASIKRERIGTLPQVNSYVEGLSDARTRPGDRRVSARRGGRVENRRFQQPLVLGDFWFRISHSRRNLRLRVAFVIQQQIPH